MNSRQPKPTDFDPLYQLLNCKTPGPLGLNDFADPFAILKGFACRLLGDTPGPLGVNDHADPGKWPAGPTNPLQKPLPAAPPPADVAPTPVATGPLNVSAGQVTFDAEGNDDPKSKYYSRVIAWPGNADSGVTLGRGYDMGGRSETDVTSDLTAAGLAADKAKAFAKGAKKKGADAKKFVDENKDTLGEISQDVQKKLFESIYPDYVDAAKANYDRWTVDAQGKTLAGKTDWDKLDPAIRDILVDFVYQGFTKGPNPMVKGMKNDFDELIKYIQTTPAISQYEPGRKRAAYLKARKK